MSEPVDTIARSALDRAKLLLPRRQRLVWMGELLFVGSWSLMWASSLDLVHFVPAALCPVIMVLGLVLRATEARKTR